MTQISKYPISENVWSRIFEIFLNTFVKIKTAEEADQFISDFLTPTEKIMLAKRLAIAFLLEKGYDYRTIQKIIRVSASTIKSVNTSRKFGSNGYRNLIERIVKEEKLVKFLDDVIIKVLSIPAGNSAPGKGPGKRRRRSRRRARRSRAPCGSGRRRHGNPPGSAGRRPLNRLPYARIRRAGVRRAGPPR